MRFALIALPLTILASPALAQQAPVGFKLCFARAA